MCPSKSYIMKSQNGILSSVALNRLLVGSRRLAVDVLRIPHTAYRLPVGLFQLTIAIIILAFANTTILGQTTHVIAHLNEKLPASGNIIYCSSFETAWKELTQNVLKEEVKLQEPLSLAGNLNRSCISAAYNNNYQSYSGFTDEGDSIICYSYFSETLEWPVEFQSFGHSMRFVSGGETTRCEYFGVHLESQEELLPFNPQVRVVEYVDEDEFVVKFEARCRTQDAGRKTNEEWGEKEIAVKFKGTKTEYAWVEIIVAKVPREKTLLKTIKSVEQRLNNSTSQQVNTSTNLLPNDILAIPKINLNVNKQYSELLGKHLANSGFEKYFFAIVEQNILFEMDEKGACAGSEATIILKKGPGERRMVLDGPFLIYLKEYGAERPYLAMWIENTEYLVVSYEY